MTLILAAPGPLCELFEKSGYCSHVSCARAEEALYENYLASDEHKLKLGHECPRTEFLNDPITIAYGVGGEMVHLVPCFICDMLD
jgi:hypothetical protein